MISSFVLHNYCAYLIQLILHRYLPPLEESINEVFNNQNCCHLFANTCFVYTNSIGQIIGKREAPEKK